jgi:putative restriction endonuclease
MIDYYIKCFANLNSDRSAARWPATTNHRSPHKPFLLLAIMDLIAQEQIQANLIQLNADLLDLFDLYWVKVMGNEKISTPILPFYHMNSEKFWHLIPVPGRGQVLEEVRQIRSMGQFQQLVVGASLDEQLFNILQNPLTRDELRRVLIETYFAPAIRSTLVEVGQITTESFQYSLELLDKLRGRFTFREVPDVSERYHTEARSAAFRRVVIDAYEHTCAICKVRLITPEGRTAVAAAHIIPWRINHNDDPRNGIALCGLHHWSFDQGLIGVASDYRILVSPIVYEDQEPAKPILLLSGQGLYLPKDDMLRPALPAINWHRKYIFRAENLPRLI